MFSRLEMPGVLVYCCAEMSWLGAAGMAGSQWSAASTSQPPGLG